MALVGLFVTALLIVLLEPYLANIVLNTSTKKSNAQQTVTDEELRWISEMIWANDTSRFSRDDLLLANSTDNKLFDYVNDDKLNTTLTYRRLMTLFDTYNPRLGVPESPCPVCDRRELDFLDAVLDTRPMQLLWQFLADKDLASAELMRFHDALRHIWFAKYMRNPQGGAPDSCGFEHVFCGELSGRGVSGFHNWVRVYLQERSSLFHLNGTIKTCQSDMRSFPFVWRGKRKRISSMFIGSSPEVELSIYTLCFLSRPQQSCVVSLDKELVRIVTVNKRGLAYRTVSTSYPYCK